MTNAILDAEPNTVSLSDEMVISWWKDWHRFLDLRQQLLDVRSQGVTAPGFDLDENDTAQREQHIRQSLGVIPVARRSVFEGELDAKIHELRIERESQRSISAAEVDLLAVERDAILDLTDIAKGDRDEGRLAAVPTGEGVWYDVDPEVVNRVPTAETYALAGKRKGPARARLIYAGLIVMWVVIGIVVWRSQQPKEEVVDVRPMADLKVNDVALQAWPVRAMRLGERELPVEQLQADAWPNPSAGAAAWQAGSVWPMRFCVSLGKDESLPTNLVLLGRGATMDREITVTKAAPSATVITAVELVACGSGATIGYGTLAQTTAQPFGVVGDARDLVGHGAVKLESVEVIGRGQDSSIPVNQARVLIRVSGSTDVDWPNYEPILVLSNGTEKTLGNKPEPDATGMSTIEYSVDAPAVPLTAAWQFVDPDTGTAYRWRVTLTPPRSRRAELTATTRLAVTSATWERGQLNIAVKVTNTGTADLALRADDFVVTQAGQDVVVSAFAEEARMLAGGKDTELTLTVFASPTESTLLYLGERGVTIHPPAANAAAGGQ